MATSEGTQSGSGSSRNRNFSVEEDLLICSAWSNSTNDSTIGIDQSGPTFWGKAHAYWLKYKNDDHPTRTPDALMQRFSRIKTSVSKFCGYLSKVQSLSGHTNDNKVDLAKKMYSELEGKGVTKNGVPKKEEFKFLQCWKELRYNQKWIEMVNEKPKGSEVPSGNDNLQESQLPHDENTVDTPSPQNVEERPIGKKLAKEGQTKRKRKFVYDSEPLLDKIDQSREMNEKLFSEDKVMFVEHEKKFDQLLEMKKEKLELEKKKYVMDEKKFEMDEKRVDTNLMKVDVSSFTDPTQVEFFKLMRKDILAKYLNKE